MQESEVYTLASLLEQFAGDVPIYFGNRFSQGWYLENRYWLRPYVQHILDEYIESTPLGSGLDYYNRIDAPSL